VVTERSGPRGALRMIGRPLGTPIGRRELGRNHRRQARNIPQRGADDLVSGIDRRNVLHRTHVLMVNNPWGLSANDHTASLPNR